jgi:hypothetical protein
VTSEQASVDGISAGSLVVHVVYVDFDGPVACQVGRTREKDVVIYGPKEGIKGTGHKGDRGIKGTGK